MPASGEDRVREICGRLPGVSERLSHGAPTWFVGRRSFVTLWADGHHDLAFPHLWCAAPAGMTDTLMAAEPNRFFRPPYVGSRGWLGMRLDRDPDWDEVSDLCRLAWSQVAPERLRSEGL